MAKTIVDTLLNGPSDGKDENGMDLPVPDHDAIIRADPVKPDAARPESSNPLVGLGDEFSLLKAMPVVEARKFLLFIRSEVTRLGKFNVSTEHMGTVLGVPEGTAEFNDRLAAYCEMARLEFTPILEHFEFRRAPVKPVPPVKK